MVEILIPRPGLAPMDRTGVPMSWWDKISFAAHSLQQCHEIVDFFGHPEYCPPLPIWLGWDNGPPGVIEGLGITTAAEMQDLAITTWGRHVEAVIKNDGRMFNFDELREKHNLPSYADADAEIRQQLWDYAKNKERNQVSLPGKRIA